MTAFAGKVKVALDLLLKDDGLDLSIPRDALRLIESFSLSDGAGANQAEFLWHDQRTLAASSSENIDLADASNSLTDAFGNPMNLTSVKMLIVINRSTTDVLELEQNGVGSWDTCIDGIVKIRPGGMFVAIGADATGFEVTGGSADIITVDNDSGNGITYDIIIVGDTT